MLNNKVNNKIIDKRGFTLVEMIVAIAVFMIVMTVAVGSLISIVNANKRARAIKNVIDNVNLAMESVSRDMRMGNSYMCFEGSSYIDGDSNCALGSTAIKYYSQRLESDVYYRFLATPADGEGNVQECIGSNCNWFSGNWQSLTAPMSVLTIKNMKFYLFGTGTDDLPLGDTGRRQPRALIVVNGFVNLPDNTTTDFNLQTTVSQKAREL